MAHARSIILWDWENIGHGKIKDVIQFHNAVVQRLIKEKFASDPRAVTTQAFGRYSDFADEFLRRTLITKLDIKCVLVDEAKKEAVDRAIEREMASTLAIPVSEAPTVVLISSDQDFIPVCRSMAPRRVVILHDAPKGSNHALCLANAAHRCYALSEVSPSTQPPAKGAQVQQKQQPQAKEQQKQQQPQAKEQQKQQQPQGKEQQKQQQPQKPAKGPPGTAQPPPPHELPPLAQQLAVAADPFPEDEVWLLYYFLTQDKTMPPNVQHIFDSLLNSPDVDQIVQLRVGNKNTWWAQWLSEAFDLMGTTTVPNVQLVLFHPRGRFGYLLPPNAKRPVDALVKAYANRSNWELRMNPPDLQAAASARNVPPVARAAAGPVVTGQVFVEHHGEGWREMPASDALKLRAIMDIPNAAAGNLQVDVAILGGLYSFRAGQQLLFPVQGGLGRRVMFC